MSESFIEKIRRLTEPEYFKFWLIPRAQIRQRKSVREIRKKGYARIVFLVSSLPMWKFQPLFDRLRKDSRFEVFIAIYPFPTLSETQKKDCVTDLCTFFTNHGISPIDLSCYDRPGEKLRSEINPDLLFYPQPYNHLYWNDLDNQFFSDKLTCYIPYAVFTSRESWAYKTLLSNTAWRLFYPTGARKQEAQEVLYNQGRNIRVTGEVTADLFCEDNSKDPWKPQNHPKKRIIWAPHFSILGGCLHRDSFSWLHITMLKVAEYYKDIVQFSFKPHPRLFSTLCEMPEWGEERVEAYYRTWADGENTQLDTGPYIDLFKGSDAMIHDSSSFSVEYLFTRKPALFTSKNLSSVLNQLNTFGQEAILAHYLCGTESLITNFIEKTVIDGEDPHRMNREAFYQKYLLPPSGNSVSENIFNEILTGLGLNQR